MDLSRAFQHFKPFIQTQIRLHISKIQINFSGDFCKWLLFFQPAQFTVNPRYIFAEIAVHSAEIAGLRAVVFPFHNLIIINIQKWNPGKVAQQTVPQQLLICRNLQAHNSFPDKAIRLIPVSHSLPERSLFPVLIPACKQRRSSPSLPLTVCNQEAFTLQILKTLCCPGNLPDLPHQLLI